MARGPRVRKPSVSEQAHYSVAGKLQATAWGQRKLGLAEHFFLPPLLSLPTRVGSLTTARPPVRPLLGTVWSSPGPSLSLCLLPKWGVRSPTGTIRGAHSPRGSSEPRSETRLQGVQVQLLGWVAPSSETGPNTSAAGFGTTTSSSGPHTNEGVMHLPQEASSVRGPPSHVGDKPWVSSVWGGDAKTQEGRGAAGRPGREVSKS